MLLLCIVILDFGRKRFLKQFGCLLRKFCFVFTVNGKLWEVYA